MFFNPSASLDRPGGINKMSSMNNQPANACESASRLNQSLPVTAAPPRVKAVVFDLDGLMFNTEDIFNEVGHEVLRRREKIMTVELLQQMMGRRAPEAMRIMIEYHELTVTVDELIDESRVLFFERATDRLAPMPGLFELLARIESRGLPKGV